MPPRPALFMLAALGLLCLSPAFPEETDPAKRLAPRVAEPGFARVALDAAYGSGSVAEAARILAYLAPLAAGQTRATLYASLAPILELEERWAEALAAWEACARSTTGPDAANALLNAGLCAIASGDAAKALSLADSAAAAGAAAPRLSLLRAFAEYVSGRRELALSRALEAVASGDPRVEPAGLLLAAELTSGADRDAYLARLKARYPGRPEADGQGLGVRVALLALSQSMGLEWTAPAGAPPAESPQGSAGTSATGGGESAAPSAGAGLSWYQVGAFRTKANAEALIKRLAAAGFAGRTATRTGADGVETTIVYLEFSSDPAAALLKLKDAGFEAWLLPVAP